MAKITKEQYDFALARIEELLPLVLTAMFKTLPKDRYECNGER